jgi:hypothetical protein
MSYFGYLAAGAADGVGRGMVGEADVADRLARERLLLAEKAQDRMDLERQRNQDRADRERENLILRKELGTGRSSGGGGGMSLFDLAERADTPEKQDRAIAAVRAEAGDEAAERFAGIFGKGRTSRLADPTRESVPGYVDATGGMDTAVPASVAVAGGQSAGEAQKGQLGLQRLLARANGKYKDYAEGDARVLGTDAVRDAGNDTELRQAGAVNMALEGKDRFGVQGDQTVDKATGAVKQTDLGNAKATDERASAGEHSAKAKKAAANPVDSDELKSLQQLRMGASDRLKDARKALTEFDKNMDKLSVKERAAKAGEREALNAEVTAARGEFEKIATRLTSRLDRASKDDSKPDAKPEAKVDAPRKITSEAQFKALKSGTRFIAPDGTTRIKP